MKIRRENSDLVRIGKKNALYMKTHVSLFSVESNA